MMLTITVRVRRTALALMTVAVTGLTSDPAPAASGSGSVAAKDAVDRALVYLEDRGDWWAEQKGCVSCHRNSFQIWSHALAADQGFSVESKKLRQWTERSMQQLLAENDNGDVVGTRNPDGAAQLLLAWRRLPDFEQKQNYRQQLVQWLRDTRQPDGSWQAAGQLPGQKRPKAETHQVSTLWNQYALESAVAEKVSPGGSDPSDPGPRGKLLQTAVSTEALAVLLLNSRDDAEAEAVLQTLKSEQNSDGGWGWIRKEDSDPLATGQVLYALAQTSTHAGLQSLRDQAVSFLLESQADNGSWPTKGTKQNRRTKVTETATYWGSAWAVIGLLESM